MFTEKLTGDQEHCLRDQVITADQPGPVLRDFRVLLEFLTPKGVEAGGKYNLLPLKCIGELDRRLSRPLHLEMKRPQLRSHPYLQGLHLLLRASGLCRVEGAGSRARLVLDPSGPAGGRPGPLSWRGPAGPCTSGGVMASSRRDEQTGEVHDQNSCGHAADAGWVEQLPGAGPQGRGDLDDHLGDRADTHAEQQR